MFPKNATGPRWERWPRAGVASTSQHGRGLAVGCAWVRSSALHVLHLRFVPLVAWVRPMSSGELGTPGGPGPLGRILSSQQLCSAGCESDVYGTVFSPRPGACPSVIVRRHGHSQPSLGASKCSSMAHGFSEGWAHGSSDVPQRCCSQSYRSACRPEELVTPAAASTCSSAAAPCPVWSDQPLGAPYLEVPFLPFPPSSPEPLAPGT